MTSKRTLRSTNYPKTSRSEPTIPVSNTDSGEEETVIHTSQIPSTSTAESATDVFATPVVSLLNTTQENSEYPTEDEIKKIGWELYASKETELRCLLHIEYLSQYQQEHLIPKGLSIHLKAGIQDEQLEEEWKRILHNCSKELVKLLVNFHATKLEKLLRERTDIERMVNKI